MQSITWPKRPCIGWELRGERAHHAVGQSRWSPAEEPQMDFNEGQQEHWGHAVRNEVCKSLSLKLSLLLYYYLFVVYMSFIFSHF
jgi:hypothetical protein